MGMFSNLVLYLPTQGGVVVCKNIEHGLTSYGKRLMIIIIDTH